MSMFGGPKKLGSGVEGDFTGYEALDYKKGEQFGSQAYLGKPLDYVPISDGGGAPAPLDEKVQLLIDSSWKVAMPKEGATRGNVAMSAHRAMPQISRPTLPPPPPPRAGGMPKLPAAPTFGRPLPAIPGQQANKLPPPPMGRGMPQLPPAPAVPQPRMPPVAQTFHSAGPVAFKEPTKQLAPHLKNVFAQDWKIMKDIPRVAAYGFRGDTRSPQAIKTAGGFNPPITRTDDHYMKTVVHPMFQAYLKAKLQIDITFQEFQSLMRTTIPSADDRLAFSYYTMWWSQVNREAMHLGRMIAQEDLKGYVSTSKATTVAKGYAKVGGFVYLLRVRNGLLIPPKGSHAWTGNFGEEEIASPNAISWDDVVGYREVGNDGRGLTFAGPVYLRDSFKGADRRAFDYMIKLLSGKAQ